MKQALRYLLDTHAFLWAAVDDDRLGREAARAIAVSASTQLAISDVTLQEIGLLLHSGRIEFKGRPSTVLEGMLNYVTVLPITPDIAVLAPSLALPHGDQFDRIITATAKVHELTLLTRDAAISDSGLVPILW